MKITETVNFGIGFLGSWGVFATSLLNEKTALIFNQIGDVNLTPVISGIASAVLTLAYAFYKISEGRMILADVEAKREATRSLKIQNDIAELKGKIQIESTQDETIDEG